MTRKEVRDRVAEFIKQHPELTYKQIADQLGDGCNKATIAAIAREYDIRRIMSAITPEQLKKLGGN